MARNPWQTLAEALDSVEEARPNWQRVQQRRNMQRWGTQSADAPIDPLALAKQQKRAALAAQPPKMTPRPGGLSNIPAGSDVKKAGPNPLYDPPANTPKQAATRRRSWMDLLDTDDEEI